MKRAYYFILCVCVCMNSVYSQDYTGVHSSTYLPFIALVNQPADLIRHNAKWHVNFINAEAGLINSQSFVQSDFWNIMGRVGFNDLKFFLGAEESLLFIHGRVMIPSLAYKLNKNNAFALTVSMRANGVYNSSNDDFKNIFLGIKDPELLKDIDGEYFKSLVNSWVEYNLSWSRMLLKTDKHTLTGGLSLKFLNGSGSGYLEMDGIHLAFDEEHISHFNMKFSYGFNKSLKKTIDGGDIVNQSGDIGLGVDLGLTYSYQPDHYKGVKGVPYKYKIGIVANDIGSIKHRKTDSQASYEVSMREVPYARFKGIETLQALKDSVEKSIEFSDISGNSFKTRLPLMLGVNIDYCVKPKIFLNSTLNYHPGYYSSTVKLVSRAVWRSSITARYETKDWGIFLPVNYSNVLGANLGIAARYKTFFIGSSTLLGNMINMSNGQKQLYFGVSIPIGKVEK